MLKSKEKAAHYYEFLYEDSFLMHWQPWDPTQD